MSQKVFEGSTIEKASFCLVGCEQKEPGEDLAQWNGGSWRSEQLGWGHRARQDRQDQGPASTIRLLQPSCIQFTVYCRGGEPFSDRVPIF